MTKINLFLIIFTTSVLFISCSNQVKSEKKEVIVLYFPNKEYVMTGNENLPKLIAEERIIDYTNKSKEVAIIDELFKGTNNPNTVMVIPTTCKVLDVTIDNNIAYVNFSSIGLNGGSLQEDMLIKQIVKTLTSQGNINQVKFLVDGKDAETLMGHIDTSKPLSDNE